MDLENRSDISTQTHPIEDGMSQTQTNSWDCGVFALQNIEKYISPSHPSVPVTQSLMSFFRLRHLEALYRYLPMVRIIQGM